MSKRPTLSPQRAHIIALSFASDHLQGHYEDCSECQRDNHCDVMQRWISNVKEALKDVENDYESR